MPDGGRSAIRGTHQQSVGQDYHIVSPRQIVEKYSMDVVAFDL